MNSAILPPPLQEGDKIAILSPASKIDPTLIDAAVDRLAGRGFKPVVFPHAKGVCGSFSGTPAERLADMRAALESPEIKAILCSRGGYGAVHLLEQLNLLPPAVFQKWLIGFSDISALHALWNRKGVASLHAAMAKHIGMGSEFPSFEAELSILCGAAPDSSWGIHPFNRQGEAKGTVVGGNMAVLGGLLGSGFSPVKEGCILLIEDIAEPIYKVERLLWQLRLQGHLSRLAGLIVGQFTDYRPSADFPDMYSMIRSMIEPYSFPVSFGAPFGHIPDNHPVLLSAEATLTVTPSSTRLTYTPSR